MWSWTSFRRVQAEHARAREKREERHARARGTRDCVCSTCGRELPQKAFEKHHIAEHGLHEDTLPVCKSCHAAFSDMQTDRKRANAKSSRDELMGRYLCGLADILRMVATTLEYFGLGLLGFLDDEGADGS